MLKYIEIGIILIALIFAIVIYRTKEKEKIARLSILVVLFVGIVSSIISYQIKDISYQTKEISENMLDVSQRMQEIEEERLKLLTFSTAKIKSNDFKTDKINNEPKGGRRNSN